MNKKSFTSLEFNKILSILADIAYTEAGKKMCLNLLPSVDSKEINNNLLLTNEAESLIYKQSSPYFFSFNNIPELIERANIGAMLSPEELVNIKRLLQNVISLKNYTVDDDSPLLKDIFNNLILLPHIVSALKYISVDGVEDDAAPELKEIRNKINNAHETLRHTLNDLLIKYSNYLQDSVITMRNGRYCIPVKTEYKNIVRGIIHDASSTGQTSFIEPLQVIEKNNYIDSLKRDEEKEVERILIEVSRKVSEESFSILSNYDLISYLDFIFAKGELSIKLNCSMPIINNDQRINLKKARHPLINKDSVIPINLYLDNSINQMIITGPNTGGKTVTLKTVGLLTLMAQSGLNIPAEEGSNIKIYNNIYVDIGDEQSIEQNLSTFSSHMSNIVKILNNIEENSLILFDELGSGTDPVEGAGLALAILQSLNNSSYFSLVTTHYSEIKYYASTTQGVINASCEFDVETLRPTYKLIVGISGKSNAFEISRKLGLSESIIENAAKNISNKNERVEDIILDLDAKKKEILRMYEEVRRKEEEASSILNFIKDEENNIKLKKEEILNKARLSASKILDNAKQIVDDAIKLSRQTSKNAGILENSRQKINKEIKNLQSTTRITTLSKVQRLDISKLKIGQSVHVNQYNQDGAIKTLPDSRGNLFVSIGFMEVKVNVKDISASNSTPKIEKNVTTVTKRQFSTISVKPEIKLIGYNSTDAVNELDKYIDNAVMSGLNTVRIIHGKGSGILRKVIHEYLKKNQSVSTYSLAEYGEGDAGVTVAHLK